jgi:hypothetical protein
LHAFFHQGAWSCRRPCVPNIIQKYRPFSHHLYSYNPRDATFGCAMVAWPYARGNQRLPYQIASKPSRTISERATLNTGHNCMLLPQHCQMSGSYFWHLTCSNLLGLARYRFGCDAYVRFPSLFNGTCMEVILIHHRTTGHLLRAYSPQRCKYS